MFKLPPTIGKLRENIVFIFILDVIIFMIYWTCMQWIFTSFEFTDIEFKSKRAIFLSFILGLAVATYKRNQRRKINKEI